MTERSKRLKVQKNFKIALFLTLFFTVFSQFSHAQSSPTETGADIYKRSCNTCHAADGSGSALGKRLHAPDLRTKEVQDTTAQAMTQLVTNGKNQMPAFKTRLDSGQIQKVVDYVRQFHADASK
jgi:cytochrome c6